MRVVTRRGRQTPQIRAIWTDAVDLVITISVTRERDAVTQRRPGWKIVVIGTGEQRFYFPGINSHYEQAIFVPSGGAIDQTSPVRRPTGKAIITLSFGQNL